MARIAFFEKKEPVAVGDKNVCQCGLSKNFPFCDSSHIEAQKEEDNKVYQYVDGKAVVIGEMKKEGGCCGGKGDDCECGDKEDDEIHDSCGCD